MLYNERELLLRIAEGDEQSFRQLYDRYFNRIFSTALAFTQSAPLAMEVVQETFIRVWKNREKLPALDNVEAYIFVIGRNRIKTLLRSQRTYICVDSLNTVLAEAGHSSPEREITMRQFNEQIHKTIGLLPEQQATVFRLSRFENCSYQEIADRMGISTDTVRNHMVKALNFMRTCFSERHKDLLLFLLLMIKINI